jgi:hypothetical protein
VLIFFELIQKSVEKLIKNLAEVMQRIDYVVKHGSTPVAFIFEQRFTFEGVIIDSRSNNNTSSM